MNASHFNQFAQWRRVTSSPNGHILTNAQVWSASGDWIYFDIRSDRHGSLFDGKEIRRVNVVNGKEEAVYRAPGYSCCGVVLAHPTKERIVFIQGPEFPNGAWSYGAARRSGMLLDVVDCNHELLDARDLVEPFTVGAHRGGTHVHQFSPAGDWISFTYEDEYLDQLVRSGNRTEKNQRNIGIAVPNNRVSVKPRHPRNQSARHYSLICSRTYDNPIPGSDQIQRAYEECWVGNGGYQKEDGSQQSRALAFLGDVMLENGMKATELFIVDLPDDVVMLDQQHRAQVSFGNTRLSPSPSVMQRRLTRLTDGYEPGLQGGRFWPRSTPDGAYLFVLKKDAQGVVQFWRVRTHDGRAEQWTKNRYDISSAFTISSDGKWLTHTMHRAICVTSCYDGETYFLTESFAANEQPLPEAVVWNPAGDAIAFIRPCSQEAGIYNQIFVVDVNRFNLDQFGLNQAGSSEN